jgi:hypothetical protein
MELMSTILSPADPKDLPATAALALEGDSFKSASWRHRGLLACRSYNKEPLDLGRVVCCRRANLDVALLLEKG